MITIINGFPMNPSGLIVPNGSIKMQLNVDGTVIAPPGGFVAANLPVVFQFDKSGALIQPAKIWSNEELDPQNSSGLGTFYLVTFFDQNGAVLNTTPLWWIFPETIGSTVDISQMVAISTVGGNILYYPRSVGTAPAGPNGSVQVNNAGVLSGDTGFTYNQSLSVVSAQGILSVGALPYVFAAAPLVVPSPTGSTTYNYAIAAYVNNVLVAISPTTTIANGPASLGAGNKNTISWTAIPGVTDYAVFASWPNTVTTDPVFVAHTGLTNYIDNGTGAGPGSVRNSPITDYTPFISAPIFSALNAVIGDPPYFNNWEVGPYAFNQGTPRLAVAVNILNPDQYGIGVSATSTTPALGVVGGAFAAGYGAATGVGEAVIALQARAVAFQNGGEMAECVGFYSLAEYCGSSGTVDAMYGVQAQTQITGEAAQTGTITLMAGVRVETPVSEVTNVPGITIGTLAGLSIADQYSFGVSFSAPTYAILIDAQTAGGMGIVVNGSTPNLFNGHLTINGNGAANTYPLTLTSQNTGATNVTDALITLVNVSGGSTTYIRKSTTGGFRIQNDSASPAVTGVISMDNTGQFTFITGGAGPNITYYSGAAVSPFGNGSAVFSLNDNANAVLAVTTAGLGGVGYVALDPFGVGIQFGGITDGLAEWGVGTHAGTPNKVNVPTATAAASGMFLISNAGSPQQTSWTNVIPFITAPSTATSTGTAGQVAFDSTHLYVCIATNTWVRATLATF